VPINHTRSGPLARSTMAYVLAGGRGSRLHELCDNRAKPAVYFGGKSRIIDFALSNAFNSGIHRIGVATQYKAHSLIRHMQRGWNFFRPERNESFDILPASQRIAGASWYAGTADAVYQNIDIIETYSPEYMVILAGDHVYKMDVELMLQQHVNQNADITVAALEVPVREATAFGVMHVDDKDNIIDFVEKPPDPPHIPGNPNQALASMGIYAFNTRFLIDQMRRDAADPHSGHDFGKDIIPYLVKYGKAVAHPFSRSCVRSREESEPYWRDVGTVDAYWEANIDLTDIVPALDLYDSEWPIWTYSELTAPAKFVHDEDGRRGSAVSIALLVDAKPCLGVVFAFSYPDDGGDLFAWAEGCGKVLRNGRPAAVLVSPEEYESWRETLAIRSDRDLMREIRAGVAALKARRARLYTLQELFA